jgi:RNA polymerase sigma-70 factor, ECF subfamily
VNFREAEDRDLVAKARQGHVDAYNLLVSRWEKRVYNYLLRLTSHREDAMDITQDVFLKGWQNLNRLEDDARFAPWLFRIAHNEAYSLLRKPKREAPELAEIPMGQQSSHGRMFPLELSLTVQAALARLSPEQRETVELKVFQGFNFEEIADILETPLSTVKSRLYAALGVLKGVLAPEKQGSNKLS